jgi:hypothetical protein
MRIAKVLDRVLGQWMDRLAPRKTAVVDHVSTFGLVKSFIIVISW